ncbi:MAG: imelysin family protein, partial [Pseudomonadota bacterium]
MRLLILFLSLLLPISAAAQSRLTPDAAALLQAGLTRTADEFVLPAYETQAWAARDMADSTAAFCAGTGDLGPAQDAFAQTFLAWQRASPVGIGPIAEAEGAMRVELWPDPKGFATRAVGAAIRAEDPRLLAPGGLAGR